jgi:hypothetical protein
MVIAGASVRKMILTFGALSLIEGSGEMLACHLDIMRYYGNHAVGFEMPVPSLVQKAGMFFIIGVVLATLVPHLRGWRWLVIPNTPYMLFIGYVLSCTFPNVLAIHGQATPPVFWVLATISAVLNGGVALLALQLPIAREYRTKAQQRVDPATGPLIAAAGAH